MQDYVDDCRDDSHERICMRYGVDLLCLNLLRISTLCVSESVLVEGKLNQNHGKIALP